MKKPKKKPVAKKKLKLSLYDRVMIRIMQLVPAAREAQGEELKSWETLGHKLLLARRMKTSVMVITVNPTMLEHREVLQKEFPCSIQNPTEARFGLDSIQKF